MSNLISGSIGVYNELKSAQFNVSQTFYNVKSLIDYDNYTHAKERQIKSTIEKFEIKEKTELIDVIELITNTISKKIQL
jgi:hypothetical protein